MVLIGDFLIKTFREYNFFVSVLVSEYLGHVVTAESMFV